MNKYKVTMTYDSDDELFIASLWEGSEEKLFHEGDSPHLAYTGLIIDLASLLGDLEKSVVEGGELFPFLEN